MIRLIHFLEDVGVSSDNDAFWKQIQAACARISACKKDDLVAVCTELLPELTALLYHNVPKGELDKMNKQQKKAAASGDGSVHARQEPSWKEDGPELLPGDDDESAHSEEQLMLPPKPKATKTTHMMEALEKSIR